VQRVFGSVAVFAGWLSIGVGALAGMSVSQFFGLNHVEGDLPPVDVYGISGAVVLWVFVAAAILSTVPLGIAWVAADPRRPLRAWAVGMAAVGLALVPDPLGRAYGLPLLVGAACLEVGGRLIHRGALATEPSDGGATSRAWSLEGDGAVMDDTPVPAPPESAASPQAVPLWTASETNATVSRRASTFAGAGSGNAASPAESALAGPAEAIAGPPPQAMPKPAAASRRRNSRRQPAIPGRVCSWCSAAVPADAITCPNCRATLAEPGADAIPIPGLTELPPELLRYAEKARTTKKRTSVLGLIFSGSPTPTATNAPPSTDAAALQPPSAALRAEMARLDEEIAAGQVPSRSEGADGTDGADDGRTAESDEPGPPTT